MLCKKTGSVINISTIPNSQNNHRSFQIYQSEIIAGIPSKPIHFNFEIVLNNTLKYHHPLRLYGSPGLDLFASFKTIFFPNFMPVIKRAADCYGHKVHRDRRASVARAVGPCCGIGDTAMRQTEGQFSVIRCRRLAERTYTLRRRV